MTFIRAAARYRKRRRNVTRDPPDYAFELRGVYPVSSARARQICQSVLSASVTNIVRIPTVYERRDGSLIETCSIEEKFDFNARFGEKKYCETIAKEMK